MLRSFWTWLLLLGVVWFFAIFHFTASFAEMTWRIFFSAGFFAVFFLSPLLRNHRYLFSILLYMCAVLAIAALWPEQGGTPNPYTLLVFSILAGKAVYLLPAWQAFSMGVILFIGALSPWFVGYDIFAPVFICLYAILLGFAFASFRSILLSERDFSSRTEALLSEYRKMKRRIATDEQLARQEERVQIGRDIHDSVGHKLTALLMQLEVARMEAVGPTKDRFHELKKIAKASLEETRNAVKALKQDDVGGLSAIISLIRKLEAESFIRVQFSVKHGALSATLGNEQVICVYRAVQEALTNIMRHSGASEADILFEAPAGKVFRFEVSNPTKEIVSYREGFGLSSMRERLENVGGSFEVGQEGNRFVVRGVLPLVQKGGMEG